MKYVLFTLIAVLLVGCGASPKVTSTVTSTPTAIPTNTSTPTATATSTPNATPTSIPTSTPTNLPSSTLVPTPSAPLRAVLITISDFATLSDQYGQNPIINDKPYVSPIILDSCSEIFTGNLDAIGTVTMILIRYGKPSDAKDINEGLKLAVTLFKTSFKPEVSIPDNFWVGKTLANGVLASATYHDVLIELQIDNATFVEPEKLDAFALLLIKNQVIRLEDGGY